MDNNKVYGNNTVSTSSTFAVHEIEDIIDVRISYVYTCAIVSFCFNIK